MIVEHGWRMELQFLQFEAASHVHEVTWPIVPRAGEHISFGADWGNVQQVHYHGDEQRIVVIVEAH